MPHNIDLSIAVGHFNRDDLTIPCLESIIAQDITCSHEIFVLDNGSIPPFQLPERFKPRIDVRRVEKNISNIQCQNACFEQARGEWVLFVANDVRLHKDCISNLWSSRNSETPWAKFWIRQPRLYRVDGPVDNEGLNWWWPGYGLAHKKNFIHTPTSFSGSCYLMPRLIWEQVGGFDEDLQSSHEDIDFALRARKFGYFTEADWTAQATHLGNQTLKHTIANPRKTFHEARIKVVTKHYRGLDRLLRLAAIHCLDRLPRF